jgi:hypothetical protein
VDNTDLKKLIYKVKKRFFLRKNKDEQFYFTENPQISRDHKEGGYKVGARYLDYSCEEFTIAECTKDLFKKKFIERV